MKRKNVSTRVGFINLYGYENRGRNMLANLAPFLAERFFEKEGVLAEPKILLHKQSKTTYRLTLHIQKQKDESVNMRLRERYNLFEEKEAFIISGFPYEFLNPRAVELIELCRGSVENDFPVLDNQGNLKIQLDVESEEQEETLLSMLKSKGFPVFRKSSRHPNLKPGLCVKFPIFDRATSAKVYKHFSTELRNNLDATLVSWLSTKSLDEKISLLTNAVSGAQSEDLMSLIREMLPPSIGLFDKGNPFKTGNGAITVNEL